MFTHAIVRKPGKSLVHGITSAPLGRPDYSLALVQHAAYVKALESCGLHVTTMDADETYPDSTFVEDTALVTPNCAIVTRPGAASRRGEVVAMSNILSRFYNHLEVIQAPGTVEAGDIMMVGDDFYIGLSARTNQAGANQVGSILQKYGYQGHIVPVDEMLHFKSGIAYLENQTVLAVEGGVDLVPFTDFRVLSVPRKEAYAANSVWVNGTVLVAKGYPKTLAMIESAGYQTMVLDVSEFRKLDGGLSCLSLRF